MIQHRNDIDGLRAVAVLAVILFHAKVAGFSFGFWGVDIFLVISGFLITKSIVVDVEMRRFTTAGFWARRIRRLMPAATLVVCSTAVAVLLLGSPLEWSIAGSDGMFSSVYLLNLSLGLREFSYFEANAEFRAFLHMWSLGLEEQFYLVWATVLPVMLRRSRLLTLAITWLIVVTSFALSVWLSADNPTVSFFLLPTRMWEFGAGCLLALTPVPILAQRTRELLASLAVVLGIIAAALLEPMTPLPGGLTALPVLSAVLLIGCWHGSAAGPARLLEFKPLVHVGKVSYSLYLWHWPVIVLGRTVVGDGVFATIVLLGVTAICGELSYWLVESRFRFMPQLVRSNRLTWVLAGVLLLVGVGSGLSLRLASDYALKEPFLASLVEVRRDAARLEACATTQGCRLSDGPETILVLGDSHAMQWVPSIEVAARNLGLAVVYAGRSGCPALRVKSIRPEKRDAVFPECTAWQAILKDTVREVRPLIVVVANYDGYLSEGRVAAGPSGSAAGFDALRNGSEELAALLESQGVRVLYLKDIPEARQDPIRCAGRSRSYSGCDFWDGVDDVRDQAAEVMARPFRDRGALVLDAAAIVCPGGHCQPTLGGVTTYRDRHHVTRSFARTQAPVFQTALDTLVRQKPK